jgi:hypothetical protein
VRRQDEPGLCGIQYPATCPTCYTAPLPLTGHSLSLVLHLLELLHVALPVAFCFLLFVRDCVLFLGPACILYFSSRGLARHAPPAGATEPSGKWPCDQVGPPGPPLTLTDPSCPLDPWRAGWGKTSALPCCQPDRAGDPRYRVVSVATALPYSPNGRRAPLSIGSLQLVLAVVPSTEIWPLIDALMKPTATSNAHGDLISGWIWTSGPADTSQTK